MAVWACISGRVHGLKVGRFIRGESCLGVFAQIGVGRFRV